MYNKDSGASGELVSSKRLLGGAVRGRAAPVGAASGEPRAAVLVLPVAIASICLLVDIASTFAFRERGRRSR